MIKLVDFSQLETFKELIFENYYQYKITVNIQDDGKTDIECENVSIEDLKEVIEIIESGKFEIELW